MAEEMKMQNNYDVVDSVKLMHQLNNSLENLYKEYREARFKDYADITFDTLLETIIENIQLLNRFFFGKTVSEFTNETGAIQTTVYDDDGVTVKMVVDFKRLLRHDIQQG